MIVAISAVGLVAYAYSLALQNNPASSNPCAPPSTSSNAYGANFQGTEYWAQNVTFTDVNQQITLAGVQFATVCFPDSSVSHLENGQCVSVNSPTTQASIQVKITFTGGYFETLSFSYKEDYKVNNQVLQPNFIREPDSYGN